MVSTDDEPKPSIVLRLLESVSRNEEQSQRKLAAELGIALGLVNVYLKRCMNKGLVKARAVPARRYAYYLTPKGFAEKSRLTADYFSSSFSFFRQARADCSTMFKVAAARGSRTVALLGISDLAEIAIICAMETGTTVSAIVDLTSNEARFVGIPVFPSLDLILGRVDAVIVTDLKSPQATTDAAVEVFGADRVLAPAFLNVRVVQRIIPSVVRKQVRSAIYEGPTVDQFRRLLSKTRNFDAVPGRLVIVCGSLQPGGAERQLTNTLVGLRGSPLESVTLLCDHLQSRTKERYDFYLPLAQSSGATIRTITTSWDNARKQSLPLGVKEMDGHLDSNLVADIKNFYFEFCNLRPEIVHAWLDWSNVRAGLAALLAGVPRILLSGRNLSPRHFVINRDYFYPAYRALIELGDNRIQLLNNSQAGANDYADWLSISKEKIRVVRNGAQVTENGSELPEHAAVFRLRHGIPASAPVVGGMFRFHPEKQPLLWLEVAGHIARLIPDVHFALFGDGILADEMKKTVRALGIENRTHFAGIITPPHYGLAACDLVLLTSSGEGTPNVLLEAQLLGLPVITTDAGGAAEAVLDGVTGTVVSMRDSGKISQAVKMALCNEKFRAAARREGPRFVKESYGLDRMVNETLDLYLNRALDVGDQLER